MIPTKRTPTRQLYDAHVAGEETPIVAGSWDPHSDVCRILVNRCRDDEPVQFWRENGPFADMILHNARHMATTRTQESARGRLHVGKWKPFDRD